MDFSKLILLPDNRLRAGWRIFIFIGLYLLATVLCAWLLRDLAGDRMLVYSVAVRMTGTLCATLLMMRFFERERFVSVGLQPDRRAWRQFGGGFLLGFVMAETVMLFEIAAGLVSITGRFQLEAAAAASLAPTLLLLLVAAATEELLFRGYPFQRLVEGLGGTAAIAITSLLFGVLHARNPDATILGVANTMLAGVLFSVAYLRTQSLWLPIGAHFAWNWALAVSGFPVSGLEIVAMPWRAEPASKAVWLYGGEYGPEGGLACTIILLMGIGVLMSPRVGAVVAGNWRGAAGLTLGQKPPGESPGR